jgi:hypothetical protein
MKTAPRPLPGLARQGTPAHWKALHYEVVRARRRQEFQLKHRRATADAAVPAARPVANPALQGLDAVPTPQEVWWALEDLWLRLAELGLIAVEQGRDGVLIVVRGLRQADRSRTGELRSVALDAETYQSRCGGRMYAFVRTLSFRDDDLVCELTRAAAVQRWPEGEELASQVRGFVSRLAAISCGGDQQGARR